MIKMHLSLDKNKNLRQYILDSILGYIVENGLVSLITSHFVGWRAALCRLQCSTLSSICRSALEWVNHIPNFYLGKYIVGYTFGNHVLRLRSRVAVKLYFQPNIRRCTSRNENFENGHPLNDHILLNATMPDYSPYHGTVRKRHQKTDKTHT